MTDLTDRMTRLAAGGRTLDIRTYGNSGELGRFHAILWSKPDKDGGQKTIANPAGLSMSLDDAIAAVEQAMEST